MRNFDKRGNKWIFMLQKRWSDERKFYIDLKVKKMYSCYNL